MRILVVANEEVWPATSGGRVRMAGLIGALAQVGGVVVAEPSEHAQLAPQSGVTRVVLPTRRRGVVHQVLSKQPHLGHATVPPLAVARVAALVRDMRPDVVVCTHSYVAAMLPELDVPVVVDFQNLEGARSASLAGDAGVLRRVMHGVEAVKARRWEPAVARRATVSVAISGDDESKLRAWGARTVVVPNGTDIDRSRCVPSPVDGSVVFLGSARYAPNADAVRLLVRDVWPQVVAARPQARLRVVGRGGETAFAWAGGEAGVEVVGTVADTADEVLRAACVVAPVRRGAGAQLKVIEALALGRVVVVTPYTLESVPPALRDLCPVAESPGDLAAAVVRLLDDPADRHAREAQIRAIGVPSWRDATVPLVTALASLQRAGERC